MAKLIGIATHAFSKGPITEHESILISESSGLKGDYQGQKDSHKSVTLLCLKTWENTCRELGITLSWTERRANLLVDDMVFNEALLGEQIQIGKILLEVTAETDPCSRMDVLHMGLKNALTPQWRGGIRCKVLRAGNVQINDKVQLLKRV